MDLFVAFISLAAAGMFIGICSGLLGIGGGVIMVPLLRLVFGLDAHMATATSLFAMVFTSFSGAVSHVRNKTCHLQLGIALGLGGAITSALGVHVGNRSPAWAIILATTVIILYSAYTMLSKALKLPKGDKMIDAAETTPIEDAPTFGKTAANAIETTHAQAGAETFRLSSDTLAKGFAIGLVAGFCAGYVGVGGGFIMVPLMTSWLHVPMKKASGTSVVAIIILAVPGVVGQVALGHVDYLAGLMLAAGSIPGAVIGARLVKHVNERLLRFLFAGFLLAAGAMLLCNEFGYLPVQTI